MMRRVPPAFTFVLKLLISAALLLFFLTRIDLGRFLQTLASADFTYVAGVLMVYLAAQLISALRWTVLARPLGFETPLKDMIVYYFIGMFFNLFAPSTVGGDVTRVYYLARDDGKDRGSGWKSTTLHATIAVLSDRAIGMVVLIWVGAAGLALFPRFAVPAPLRLLTFALAIGFALGGLLIPTLGRVLPANGHPLVTKAQVALNAFQKTWNAILLAMLLSATIHIMQAAMHVWIGRALHIEVPFSYCFIIYPLVGAFAALPISFNGIGLREGGYLFMLGIIGVDSEKAIAFGLLLFVIVAL
ncbi:MAG: lysylphosphatidylglycerol synthase transmembrane domain-containing protein, partial [Candidatus Binatia bacterium]